MRWRGGGRGTTDGEALPTCTHAHARGIEGEGRGLPCRRSAAAASTRKWLPAAVSAAASTRKRRRDDSRSPQVWQQIRQGAAQERELRQLEATSGGARRWRSAGNLGVERESGGGRRAPGAEETVAECEDETVDARKAEAKNNAFNRGYLGFS